MVWLAHGRDLHHLLVQNYYANVLFTLPDISAVDCGPLNDPENGNITFTSTGFNATATYMCNEGFVLEGNAMRICQFDDVWSGSDPTCGKNVYEV